jgi:hypothetical protein
MVKEAKQEWLLIFYSVPSHPVSSRMKIWRKLVRSGAVQLKGAVYIIPATDEHQEFFQWLIGEVRSLGGDGAFAKSSAIETMSDAEIRGLFLGQISEEYRGLEKAITSLEQKVQSIRKGTKLQDRSPLADQLARTTKDFEDIRKRDFFSSPAGAGVYKRLQQLQSGLEGLDKHDPGDTAPVSLKRAEKYQNRVWITRKKPFVDRMASAWLIKRFIDPNASFKFIDERELNAGGPGTAAFDLRNGEFTHVGDLCTFEVLVKAFGIRDKAVKQLAEIVHDLDVKDEKYDNAGTAGVEEILSGIRKTGKNDSDALEKGMAVFEMLYQSKTY